MATVEVTTITDDLEARYTKDVRTVTFSIDGESYEIDLCAVNRKHLAKRMEKYITNGRKVNKNAAIATSNESVIRQWAQQKGIPVSGYGRIANSVINMYNEAH